MGRWLGKILASQGGGAPPAGFFAAPAGSATGDGSIGDPWDLQTAFSGGFPANTLQPGDTCWMRGGTYNDQYTVTAAGGVGNEIVYRSYPGEWAVIDANVHPGELGNGVEDIYISGNDLIFRDFEVFDSGTVRFTPNNPENVYRGDGFYVHGPRVKVINCVVHDCGQGITVWNAAPDSEVYGNILYYNGWENPAGGVGHNIYVQNDSGVKLIKRNFTFEAHANCFQAFGSSASSFINSTVEENAFSRAEFEMGGNSGFELTGTVATANMTWDTGAVMGYHSHVCDPFDVTNNYFINIAASYVITPPYDIEGRTGFALTGNTFVGDLDDDLDGGPAGMMAAYPTNTYYAKASPPGTDQVFILSNTYEAGRALIVVYNWDGSSTQAINLSSFLLNGDQYAIYNGQNILAAAIATGTYTSGTVSFPMTGLTKATPVGYAASSETNPAYAVFIVRKTG